MVCHSAVPELLVISHFSPFRRAAVKLDPLERPRQNLTIMSRTQDSFKKFVSPNFRLLFLNSSSISNYSL